MVEAEREYAYKSSWTRIALSSTFFSCCAFSFFSDATSNDRALVIDGLIQLSPARATVFYWVLGGLSLAFVASAGALAYQRLTCDPKIILTQTAILIPDSIWKSDCTEIPFSEITGLATPESHGQRFLYVYRSNGLRYTINGALLPSKQSFDELNNTLSGKMPNQQPNVT